MQHCKHTFIRLQLQSQASTIVGLLYTVSICVCWADCMDPIYIQSPNRPQGSVKASLRHAALYWMSQARAELGYELDE
jgi:hypothetical protein